MRKTLLENVNKSWIELCQVRDRCVTSILKKEENYTIIEILCTYKNFIYVFVCVLLISNVECKMRIKNY